MDLYFQGLHNQLLIIRLPNSGSSDCITRVGGNGKFKHCNASLRNHHEVRPSCSSTDISGNGSWGRTTTIEIRLDEMTGGIIPSTTLRRVSVLCCRSP